ncbi:hypothetical protein [Kitasatospora sp. MAP5-34]|uniref:hypothetical protein n=1 Tax=Kitasatospora sp. MAP5-34 TaxID=3035102 RepID=UPI002476D512|nr:hypothetical protein [Kitasatospora sp. MAP5-34]MDH6579008.1 hypothetical protein [Kitasatospora sp. MAP5-34]
MDHNDVARRTAHTMPARALAPRSLSARSLTPRTLGLLEPAPFPDPTVHSLERPLRGRKVIRFCEGGR